MSKTLKPGDREGNVVTEKKEETHPNNRQTTIILLRAVWAVAPLCWTWGALRSVPKRWMQHDKGLQYSNGLIWIYSHSFSFVVYKYSPKRSRFHIAPSLSESIVAFHAVLECIHRWPVSHVLFIDKPWHTKVCFVNHQQLSSRSQVLSITSQVWPAVQKLFNSLDLLRMKSDLIQSNDKN